MKRFCVNNNKKVSESVNDETLPKSTVTLENLRLKERVMIVVVIFNQLYHTRYFTLRSLIRYDGRWHTSRETLFGVGPK